MFVLGAVVSSLVLRVAGGSATPAVGDRVMLTTGGSIAPIGASYGAGVNPTRWSVELPLTAAEAVAAGWKDPILCSPGRGRYFQKGTPEEGEPFFLLYNDQDELIGI